MHKQLCACGCGVLVTRKVELQHMNARAPTLLISQVPDQNRTLIRQKKRSQAIGFPAPFYQRLTMGNTTTEINDPVSLATGSSMLMGEGLTKAYGQSKSHHSAPIVPRVKKSKSFENIGQIFI